ncbi:hypothetical protein IG631_05433 [Alternaria alternata]|jgi:hypothetical protein|nr:hypothetical protein IG631_05433 [Alternaria alternata]
MIGALSNAPVHLLDFDVGDRGLCGFACATTSGAHPRFRFGEPILGSAARRQSGRAKVEKILFRSSRFIFVAWSFQTCP